MKISFLDISKAYQSYLRRGASKKKEACPGIESILESVLSETPKEGKDEIVSHAANCYECSILLKRALEISKGIDDILNRNKTPINQHSNEVRRLKKRSFFIFHNPVFITMALLCVLICGIYIVGQKRPSNTRNVIGNENVVLINPGNTKIGLDELKFAWENVHGAKYYFMELFDVSMNLVWRSEHISNTTASLPIMIKDKLSPGKYYWKVTVVKKEDTTLESKLKEFSIIQ